MNHIFRVLLRALAVGGLGLGLMDASAADGSAKKRVLFFTKSSGFEHDAIKLTLKDGRRGFAYPVVEEIARQHDFEVIVSKDGSLFSPEYLAQFDAFLFYTTGDLTQPKSDPRGDGLPPMTPAGKEALLAAIDAGKGFVGVHSATDSFHTAGRNTHVPERFQHDGERADPYIKMLGGEFIRHGKQQTTQLSVVDRLFPGLSAVPDECALHEEWYSLKNFAPDMHVLLVQETAGMEGHEYQRAPYPCTWARLHGKGRVYYTSLGHREDVWTNPMFQSLLAGALNWALRNVEADVTPNLERVAPKANELPKYVAPKPAPASKAP